MKKIVWFVLAIFIGICIIVFSILNTKFDPFTTIDIAGYAYSDENLLKNLMNADDKTLNDQNKRYIDVIRVSDNEMVFKKLNSYYIGLDKKQKINLEYPIFMDDQITISNYSNKSELITDNFEFKPSYSNISIQDGAIYNKDTYQRADKVDYLFLKTSDNLYVNLEEFEINTRVNKYIVPVNSIMYFSNDFISYYSLDKGKLVLNIIKDIDETSTIGIKTPNITYSYDQLLKGLKLKNITQEQTEIIDLEENQGTSEEETRKLPQIIVEKNIIEKKEEEEEQEIEVGSAAVTWFKPSVECSDFSSGVYSINADVKITDQSRVIYKGVTFTLYKNDALYKRASCSSSRNIEITMLEPDTTYRVIGSFQFKTANGNIIENQFTDQTITTQSIDSLNPIEFKIENGQMYSTKIELKKVAIVSDLTDEALKGVKSAIFNLNDEKINVETVVLKNLILGKEIKYEPKVILLSNTPVTYSFKLYDTVGNEMNLIGNSGQSQTSRQSPTTRINVDTSEITTTIVKINIINPDNIDYTNQKYILYSGTGEQKAQGSLTKGENVITFENLNPGYNYNIRVFADFDLLDNKGMNIQSEIGSTSFTTFGLSSLGNILMDIGFDEVKDFTNTSAKLKFNINKQRTEERLYQILDDINIKIRDNKNNAIILDHTTNDISKFISDDGYTLEIDHLMPNSQYNIELTSNAKQGEYIEKIRVSSTVKSFKTKKTPISVNITHQIVTNKIIDMDVYVSDPNGASRDGKIGVILYDSQNKEIIPTITSDVVISKTKEIPTNTSFRLTYSNLVENMAYKMIVYVNSYNETSNEKLVTNNYKIIENIIETSGLYGDIELSSLYKPKKSSSANLLDAKSEVNWYSKCFGVAQNRYEIDESNDMQFIMDSKYDYGKVVEEIDNGSNYQITLKSNQCYVYNLKQYYNKDQPTLVTISFDGKITNSGGKVYLQKGKQIGTNIDGTELEEIPLNTSGFSSYTKTLEIPKDGHIGFYVEKYNREIKTPIPGTGLIEGEEVEYDITYEEVSYDLILKSLQIELGDEKTSYSNFDSDLNAKIRVEFLDQNRVTQKNDVCKYYIKIKSNTGNNNDEIDYTYVGNSTIVKEYEYLLNKPNIKEDFNIKLLIKQYNREYVLDEIDFSYIPDERTEIKSIEDLDQYLDIQPNGSYNILNNINLIYSLGFSDYTFGSSKIKFNGYINFNGKTVTKDTTSIPTGQEVLSYMFYEIGNDATIENLVLNFQINDKKQRQILNIDSTETIVDQKDGLFGMFLYNYGNLNNINVNLTDSTKFSRENVALMGYKNSGIIDKFIICYEKKLYTSRMSAGVCLYCDGTIQNGYIYGDGIESQGTILSGAKRDIAGVCYQLDGVGLMQNIYNITQITLHYEEAIISNAANIAINVGYPPVVDEITGDVLSIEESFAKVFNVYSTQALETYINYDNLYYNIDEDGNEDFVGPNILNQYTSTRIDGSRYYCDISYEDNKYNIKSPPASLFESGIQEEILNSNGQNAFEVEKFVSNGYYPHLILNYCMPEQTNIKIEILTLEFIDVLSGKPIELTDIENYNISDEQKNNVYNYIRDNNIDLSDENIHLFEFRIYNPAGTTVTDIDMNFMQSTILSQFYEKKISTAFLILHSPTSFLDEYEVKLIRAIRANGTGLESVYGNDSELGKRVIDVTFVKYIENEQMWDAINEVDENEVDGLIQNYRLVSDLDFESQRGSEFSGIINGKFQGKLNGMDPNGNVHVVKNIKSTKSIFASIDDATIENINFENIEINIDENLDANTKNNVGLIGKIDLTKDIYIRNIHIKDFEIISNTQSDGVVIGGIISSLTSYFDNDVTQINIDSCSISNLNIEFENPDKATNIHVGGILGAIYLHGGVDLNINSCYIQNGIFNCDVLSNNGVGGIIGYTYYNADERRKLGTPHGYINNCYTTGKINSKTRVGGICGRNYSATYINKCFSIMTLNSTLTSGEAFIGGIMGNTNGTGRVKNCLYLGNIYITGNSCSYLNRIVGNDATTNSYSNYANKDQIMLGATSTSLYGATALLTYEQIFSEDTFLNKMKLGDEFVYDVVNSQGNTENLIATFRIPMLKDTTGKLAPYQNFLTLDNDLKLVSITTTPSADKTYVTVNIKMENPNSLELKGVVIENEDMTVDMSTWNVVDSPTNGINYSTITFIATPNKAFDSYKIATIKYVRTGTEAEKEILTKIKIELFKKISNADEWNEFFENRSGRTQGDGIKYPGQNIKIAGDIDFNNVSSQYIGYIASQMTIGRLEADTRYTFKNITLAFNDSYRSFITEVKTTLKNLNFENVIITGKGDYNGLIGISRAQAQDCNFSNVKIEFKNGSSGYSYTAIVPRCLSGSFKNIVLNNIRIYGGSYTGGLVGYSSSMGVSDNINAYFINVESTGSYVGGIIGYATGTFTNVQAYQYSQDGSHTPEQTTSYMVKGYDYIGGVIGRYFPNSGSYKLQYITVNNSKISGRTYVGADCGNVYGNTYNMTARYNTVEGTNQGIGANVGFIQWYTNNDYTAEQNIVKGRYYVGGNVGNLCASCNRFTSINNKVYANTASDAHSAGGNIGRITTTLIIANYLRVSGIESYVEAKSQYAGGSVGYNIARIRNIKVQDSTVVAGSNYAGGAIGRSDYINLTIPTNSNTNYSIAGVYVINTSVTSNQYSGGIIGESLGTLYAGFAQRCRIKANSNYSGGISGSYKGSAATSGNQISSDKYYLWHCGVDNCIITSNNNSGGITGTFKFGNIQNCYVQQSSIIAYNQNAGGLIGLFENMNMTSLQYKAWIKYNYIANTNTADTTITIDTTTTNPPKLVFAKYNVGGLIGKSQKSLKYDSQQDKYNNIECNLIATNIVARVDSNSGNIHIGAIENTSNTDYKYMNNIYVFEGSKLNGTLFKDIAYIGQKYKLATVSDLSTQAFYTKNTKKTEIIEKEIENPNYDPNYDEEEMGPSNINKKDKYLKINEEVISYEGLNFQTSRFQYVNGEFPRLQNKFSSADSYWESSNLNVQQPRLAVFSLITSSIIENENSQIENISLNSLTSINDIESPLGKSMIEKTLSLPEVYIYPSGIDTLNIEFSYENENILLDLFAYDKDNKEIKIAKQMPITNRVYSFFYNFDMDIYYKVYTNNSYDCQRISKQDLRNKVLINNDKYYYLVGTSLYQNEKEIFVQNILNIFYNKALDEQLNIIDLNTFEKTKSEFNINDNDGIYSLEFKDNPIPLSKNNYNDSIIETYYKSYKVQKDDFFTYKSCQLFIKNNQVYYIDNKNDNYSNCYILDKYNDYIYITTLGKDGKIVDLMDKINYPKDFKNDSIIQISSNYENNCFEIMAYYANKVVVFNYYLGEIVFEKQFDVENTTEQINDDEIIATISSNQIQEKDKIKSQKEADKLSNILLDYPIDNNQNSQKQYITSLNNSSNQYEVYEINELLDPTSSFTFSQNYKIYNDEKLTNFYSKKINKKSNNNSYGYKILAFIVVCICFSLLYMNRKLNLKVNTKLIKNKQKNKKI